MWSGWGYEMRDEKATAFQLSHIEYAVSRIGVATPGRAMPILFPATFVEACAAVLAFNDRVASIQFAATIRAKRSIFHLR